MSEEKIKPWRLNRQINVSVIIQLFLLASLILGSWINLQRQLYLLQKDVSVLLSGQEKLELKMESVWSKSISHEYRLKAIEKQLAEESTKKKTVYIRHISKNINKASLSKVKL